MEKQYKIDGIVFSFKGLKKEIENFDHALSYLTHIDNYKTEKRGVIGGEIRSTTFYVMFGTNPLRDIEGFKQKKADFLAKYNCKVIIPAMFPEFQKEVTELFNAHHCIEDLTKTPEQEAEALAIRNKNESEYNAKREQERIKTDQEKEQLKKQYPFLALVTNSGISSRIMATKNIRTELDKAFPSLVFSIRSETYSGGDSINVDWVDGASKEEVEKITRKYQQGHFDGMNDIYEYGDRAFNDLFGGVKYLFNNRSLLSKSYYQVAEKLGYAENFQIKDEHTWELIGIEDQQNMNRIHNEITREANQTSFYVKPEKIEVSAQDIQSSHEGITVQENKVHQGIEIKFDSKPSPEIISKLKANRFRWNGRTKVWYCKLNANSLRFANQFVKPQETPETIENPENGLETQSDQAFESALQTESIHERF